MRGKQTGKTVVVGLTGGIASGKTTVAEEFRKRGAHIIDSDHISRDVTMPGMPAYRKVVRAFGHDIVRSNGTLDRRKLGRIVFRDPGKRKVLEEIIHPAVIAGIEQQLAAIKKKNARIIVVDIPLLFEAGLERYCDTIVVVWASKKVQLQRLMQRDRLTAADARMRLGAQWPLIEKRKRADYVINNGGGRAQAKSEVKKVWRVLTKYPELV